MNANANTQLVCLCGSSRFTDIMAVCAWLIEKEEGKITTGLHFLPAWYISVPDHLAEHEGVADKMDALHMRKIDACEEVFVVNVGDYIGDSTRREIEYAMAKGKLVRWFTHDPIGAKVSDIILHHRGKKTTSIKPKRRDGQCIGCGLQLDNDSALDKNLFCPMCGPYYEDFPQRMLNDYMRDEICEQCGDIGCPSCCGYHFTWGAEPCCSCECLNDCLSNRCILCHITEVIWPTVCDACQDKEAQAILESEGAERCRSCGMFYDGGDCCTYCGDMNPTDDPEMEEADL